MNKNLKFASDLVPLVLNGSKVSTWRLWDDKELSVGDIVDFLEFGSQKPFATAKLTKVIEKPLGELTDEDKKGHETFTSDEEMYKTYMKYYNRPVDGSTPIKLIWFELVENSILQKTKEIIENNIYCTIATATLTGKPWISPVFYGYDTDYTIYWISDKEARHSQLIRNNPEISLVIFNSQAPEGEGDGVYIEAEAVELTEREEIEKGYAIRDARVSVDTFKVKDITEVMHDGAWRVYKAMPKHIYKLSDGEYKNGQYVDKRIKVIL